MKAAEIITHFENQGEQVSQHEADTLAHYIKKFEEKHGDEPGKWSYEFKRLGIDSVQFYANYEITVKSIVS